MGLNFLIYNLIWLIILLVCLFLIVNRLEKRKVLQGIFAGLVLFLCVFFWFYSMGFFLHTGVSCGKLYVVFSGTDSMGSYAEYELNQTGVIEEARGIGSGGIFSMDIQYGWVFKAVNPGACQIIVTDHAFGEIDGIYVYDVIVDKDMNITYTVTEQDTKEREWETISVASNSRFDITKNPWSSEIYSEKANPPGENLSPDLSYSQVAGAGCYAIYMLDVTAGNWIHWIVKNETKTSLELGAAGSAGNMEYVGPYPPSGMHEYVVYVYALKQEPDTYAGEVDKRIDSIEVIENALDTAGGKSGNIIGKGSIAGTASNF